MICPAYPDPQYFIFSNQVPALLYYSHVPAIIVSLFVGFFVYFKNKHSLLSKILLSISLTFSIWVFLNLIAWTNNDSNVIMFIWSFFGILYALLCVLCLYFVYVFINKNDITFKMKMALGFLLLPVFIFAPTNFNIYKFDLSVVCGVLDEGVYYANYYYGIGFIAFLWILFFLIFKYRKSEKEHKNQIVLLGIGIELFLLSFFVTGYISSLLTDNFYKLEFYGLFGMTFFMGVLTYLIVKYEAFEIKLIGAQALVVALIILIGSQFFFVASNTNRILTGITLAMAIGFGIFLIKSVQNEVKRKEELQYLTEKLAIANDELRKLDNAKSEFISIASHQLRTPLTSIKGYISLLLEGNYGKIDEVIMDPISKIYASNERLIQLVEELLNVSRIESGRMEYIFEKSSIEKITTALKDTFSVIAKGKGLYMHLNMPSEPLPEIEIDAGKTREVISNLIDNALKYTRRGGITVKSELLRDMNWSVKHAGGQDEDLSGDVVRITISDTGIGVPETELPYLFSKFSRGKDTSRLHVSGTGLGLYVGRNIIEAQHGKIWVESDGLNKGSKFIIDLPVVQPK